MSNWRDPVPSDYKLPPKESDFEESIAPAAEKKIFPVLKNLALAFVVFYLFFSFNSLRSEVRSISDQIKVPYPEVSNPQKLTEMDILNLIEYYGLNEFSNVDCDLLIDSEDVNQLLEEDISEDGLNTKFSILSMIFKEIDSGRLTVSNKDELEEKVKQIKGALQ